MAEKVTARFIIEVAGKPKEKVDEALNYVMKKLQSKENKFKIIEEELIESELDEKSSLFGGFIEVTAKFDSIQDLMVFVLDYTPTSIEVESPSKIALDNGEFSAVLGEFSKHMLNSLNTIRRLNATAVHLDKELKLLKGRNHKPKK
ncbi:MAG: hypothetical protein ACOCXG_03930 [Nanoarchaeota archaeon]